VIVDRLEVDRVLAELKTHFPGFRWMRVKRGQGLHQFVGIRGMGSITVALFEGQETKWWSRLDYRKQEIISSYGSTAITAVDRLFRRAKFVGNLVRSWEAAVQMREKLDE
jgi:hypothetical protein